MERGGALADVVIIEVDSLVVGDKPYRRSQNVIRLEFIEK
jgi:hypothetical protein